MSKTGTGTFVQVDYHKINELFKTLELSNNEARKAVRAGLRQSGNIIRKQAEYNLKNVFKKNGSLLHYQPLLKFLRISIFKDSRGVTITGIDGRRRTYKKMKAMKKSADYSYILRFFNMGALDRETKYTKKKYNRGSIQASHFFDNAVETKSQEAMNQLSDNIIAWVNKVAARRK